MKFDVISFGGAVVDAFFETDLKEKNGGIYIPLDRKLLAKEIWFATGGAGTNTAVSFSKLGLKAGFLGKVGNDHNGKIILDELKSEHVSFLGNVSDGLTGFSAVIDSVKRNRSVLVYRGVNDLVRKKDFELDKIDSDWYYLSAMTGESLKYQNEFAEKMKKRGAKIAYNSGSYVTKNGIGPIRKILKNCDILILNEGEARDLAVKKEPLNALYSLGPKIVCITRGENGNLVYDGRVVYTTTSHKVKVTERTGAGDAFSSGFVAGMFLHNDIQKAIQFGSLNAESVIQKHGAKKGLLTRRELERRVRGTPVKIVTKVLKP